MGFGWATRAIAFVALGSLAIPVSAMKVHLKPASARRLIEPLAWTEMPYTLFNIGQFFGVMGLYVPFYYAGLNAVQQQHASEGVAFYIFSIVNAGGFFGRIVPNYFADRWGPFNVLVPCSLIAAALAFAWIGVKSTAGLIVFCLLYGFFSGAFISIPPSCIVSLSPDLSVVGIRVGMSFALASFGILIGNPSAGAILGAGDSGRAWIGLKSWCATCVGIATIFIISARIKKTGWKLIVKA